ncbi:hypothetical protein AYL99_11892 [Fonsecaea erecta]|uniref:Uncharacterized protein n=1 Tax=Fonsecaea erecta TaxID=1367422 RepID=A0A178Z265_9EURO|nr:hypothetical protein AYL99_11892 [Fonsecaea erecta]OAP53870.1 hypothetical protein AYL99_11892 [Fonsecaea erecta]
MSFEDQKIVNPNLPKGDMIVRGKRLTFTDTNKKARTVRATYEIMRVLQLRHIAALKHHYPSMVFGSITIPKGELVAIVMQNCTSVVMDAIITDNYVVFISCPVCNRTVIGYGCPYPKPPSTEKIVRYSMLILAVFAEVYIYNTSDSVPLGIKFITQT